MLIRKLMKKDLAVLTEIVFRYKCSLNPDFQEENKKSIKQAFINAMKEKNSRALVCLNAGGLIAGYILFHLVHYPMLAGREVYVSDLLINETERGSGVGSSLLSKAEEFAKQNQCVRVMLNNPKESEGYRRDFYKKHGYTERLTFANFVKDCQC